MPDDFYDEKEYWLNNPPEPSTEIDPPLCAMDLFDLQRYVEDLLVSKEPHEESIAGIKKFLDKNFI